MNDKFFDLRNDPTRYEMKKNDFSVVVIFTPKTPKVASSIKITEEYGSINAFVSIPMNGKEGNQKLETRPMTKEKLREIILSIDGVDPYPKYEKMLNFMFEIDLKTAYIAGAKD